MRLVEGRISPGRTQLVMEQLAADDVCRLSWHVRVLRAVVIGEQMSSAHDWNSVATVRPRCRGDAGVPGRTFPPCCVFCAGAAAHADDAC